MADEPDLQRYRQAATLAVDQLDWCIRYLRRIGKDKIAAQLEKNSSTIRRRLPAHERE